MTALPFSLDELGGTVVDRLRAVAALQPDAPALAGEGERLTYGQLQDLVDGLARWLATTLGDADGPVVLLTPHAPVTIVAEFAVIALGRAAVPLDPSFPPQRLAEQIADAAPAAIVCGATTQAALDAVPIEGHVPTLVWDRLADLPSTSGPPVEGPTPDAGAFLLYTSGSTGRPKGVVLNHRAFLAASQDLAMAGTYAPGDRVANLAPLAFGAGVATTLWSLLAGAEMCLFPLRERGLASAVDWMRREEITAFSTVPTVARALAGVVGPDPVSRLRTVVVGGETVQPADVPLLRAMASGPLRIVTVYASTELMLMAWGVIEPGADHLDLGPTPIGQPVTGFEIELDPLDDLPDTGEIVITCPVVDNGYVGLPELTRERFVPIDDGRRVRFRTGDLGRRVADDITIVGRTDAMVKIRGSRVELDLVEEALRSAPGVAQAIVTPVPRPGGDLALVAHVSSIDPHRPADPLAARGHLRRNLPPQMVPLRVLVHEELPHLPNGKVDRGALQALPLDLASAGVAPRNDLERRLQKRLRAATGIEDLGVTDDLFEMGVDSLVAIEILVHLEEEFGARLPMSSWIDLASIEDLAKAVQAEVPVSARSTVVQIQRGEPSRPPLLVTNDLHGTAFRYRHLAEALGGEQPVLALDSPLLAGPPERFASLAEVARRHVDDLLAARPEGPHHLLGYSWGTMLVAEMVRELQRRGAMVGFVGMLDFGPVHLRHRTRGKMVPRPPDGWSERAPSDLPLADRVAHHARQLREEPPGRKVRYVARVADLSRYYDRIVSTYDLRTRGEVRPDLRANFAWYQMVDLAHRYRFQPIDHDITLFASDQTRRGRITRSPRLDYASATDPTFGWDRYVRGTIDVRDVYGHHNDLVEPPYVTEVGRTIRQAFDDWLAGDRT